jgi:hypothetical protein
MLRCNGEGVEITNPSGSVKVGSWEIAEKHHRECGNSTKERERKRTLTAHGLDTGKLSRPGCSRSVSAPLLKNSQWNITIHSTITVKNRIRRKAKG